MNKVFRFILAAIVVAASASCTHYPRANEPTDEVTKLRSDYLKNNPDGKFNERIARGEVSRGMNGIEVLASWGIPDVREPSRMNNAEMWTYYHRDEHTRDYVLYDLFFKDRTLTRWDLTRVTASMGFATYREFQRAREASLREPTGYTAQGTVKKR